MSLPPRWLRRVTVAPALVVLTVLLVTTLPLWTVLAAAASPLLPGRWRPLRLVWMVTLYLVLESVVLVVLLGLWLATGLGWRMSAPWSQRAHYALVGLYLRVLYAEAGRVLGVRVRIEGDVPRPDEGRPLLVFSRHAGPGDSFLLVHALVSWYDREPRVVLKDTLQWDPAIDVVLNRLPNRFLGSGSGRQAAERIRDLARGLDHDDAVLLFPEGGNFTERRRMRAVERLRARGLLAEAERAQAMRHVLAPRPGGVVAALEGAPQADVVWVAHTGLDHLHSVADVWRALPVDTTIVMRWWRVPADEVPRAEAEQTDWLYAWWERIDAWIAEERLPQHPA